MERYGSDVHRSSTHNRTPLPGSSRAETAASTGTCRFPSPPAGRRKVAGRGQFQLQPWRRETPNCVAANTKKKCTARKFEVRCACSINLRVRGRQTVQFRRMPLIPGDSNSNCPRHTSNTKGLVVLWTGLDAGADANAAEADRAPQPHQTCSLGGCVHGDSASME